MSVMLVGVRFVEDGATEMVGGFIETPSPCLCAQLSPFWTTDRLLTAEEWIKLRADADPRCPWCHGTGCERHRMPQLYLNWGADTTERMLTLLGLAHATYAAELPAVRRGIMLARATFDRVAPGLVRPEVSETGHLTREDGTIQLRAFRFYQPELGLEAIRHRLEVFATFVEACAAAGATAISWPDRSI